jgi:hypothetical protein
VRPEVSGTISLSTSGYRFSSLEAPREREIHERSRVESDYFRVRMPRVHGMYIPMGGFYHMAAPFTSDDPYRPILLFWERAYCEAGGILWSQDPGLGGPPYWIGREEEDRVPKLLDSLEALGAFNSPVRHWDMLRLDSSMYVIAIAAGPRRLFMQSHLRVPVPQDPDRSELDQQFCQLWCELDSALMSLRPDNGKQVNEVKFEVDWLP